MNILGRWHCVGCDSEDSFVAFGNGGNGSSGLDIFPLVQGYFKWSQSAAGDILYIFCGSNECLGYKIELDGDNLSLIPESLSALDSLPLHFTRAL
jgi:hypothetical protein